MRKRRGEASFISASCQKLSRSSVTRRARVRPVRDAREGSAVNLSAHHQKHRAIEYLTSSIPPRAVRVSGP
ncbi:hypothetical protein RRG08_041053 [Elysia crispata]|uniref:Uncharacterized protein n=1 Tax=Elysia crispata TaxID=231223 RepID=A0AAE1CUF8_9GAST|nr:hypothetical protein RRG08_041053 [Elysia crispata]